jgi:(p)ppGpp synthase/HD superfamily hydrolase
VVEAVYPSAPTEEGAPEVETPPAKAMIRGIRRGAAIQFCTCCWPIPGDRIIGLSRKGGVVVHAISCPMLADFENDLERWHDLAWDPEASKKPANVVRIDLTLANLPGALGAVCTLVGEQQANIDNLDVTLRKPDFFQMTIDIEIRDTRHLGNILTALRAQSFVSQVDRAVTPPADAQSNSTDGQARLPLGSAPAQRH